MGSQDPELERRAGGVPEDPGRTGEGNRGPKPRTRIIVGLGLVAIVALSVWMSVASNPIAGIASFFGLTGLLWAVARLKHWI